MSKPYICVITGATGGLGADLVKGFKDAGYQVVGLDVNQHKDLPEGIDFRPVDLHDKGAVAKVFNEIKETYGAIHVLINNAAIAGFHKELEVMTQEEFEKVLDVNVFGTFACCKSFIEHHQGADYGRIINIASTRWYQNEAGWDAYGSSKGALVSMTHSMAVSLSHTPITVNAVSPGWIQAEGYEQLTQQDHRQHPSGRVGKPGDITRACLFLADPQNDFINGHNLVVDGGMTKRMIYV